MRDKSLRCPVTKSTRPFITAELGTLHLSSLDNLKRATEAMFEAGVDAVKVQLIRARTAWWADRAAYKRYLRHEAGGFVKELLWPQYFAWARDKLKRPVYASFFCTSFFEAELHTLMPYVKLGYKVRYHPRLLEAAHKARKPLFISYGAGDTSFAQSSLSHPVQRLFVQPSYPTHHEDFLCPWFQDTFAGISLHTKRTFTPTACAIAIHAGARFLELHTMHSKSNPEGPDTTFALNETALAQLIKDIAP